MRLEHLNCTDSFSRLWNFLFLLIATLYYSGLIGSYNGLRLVFRPVVGNLWSWCIYHHPFPSCGRLMLWHFTVWQNDFLRVWTFLFPISKSRSGIRRSLGPKHIHFHPNANSLITLEFQNQYLVIFLVNFRHMNFWFLGEIKINITIMTKMATVGFPKASCSHSHFQKESRR